MGGVLKKKVKFFILFFLIFSFSSFCSADEEEIRKEIQELKKRIVELEAKLAQQEEKTKGVEEIKEIFSGLSIGGGATIVLQGTHNANNTSGKKEDVTDASYSMDLEIEKIFEEAGGRAFLHLESGQGTGVEDELTLFSNVNYDANSDESLKVSELYYEQNLFDKKIIFTFGKLDPTAYLDTNAYANDETTQFLGRMFGNSPTIEFPDNTFGLHLGMRPEGFFEFDLVLFDGDSDYEDVFDKIFLGTQVNFKPEILGREGNYRLIGWLSNRNHIKWLESDKDKERNYGFGISFDQEFTDYWGAFFRFGWQNPEVYLPDADFSLERTWSAGLEIKGDSWKREGDCLGLALGQVIPSDDYKGANSERNAKKETHFEAYYRLRINDHLHISPDIQVIWNPYGDDIENRKDTITVFGLRTQIDF
ncbi:MAG: carbohydrate porin [Candidatus Omnitrophota bacterium]